MSAESRAQPALIQSGPIASLVLGAGEAVVLVHGSLGDYRQWTGIAEPLSRTHRVHAVSRRYHWPNQGPDAGASYTHDEQAADLLEYIRRAGAPAHIVGHSYGAGIALLAVMHDPSCARSLVLIEPAFQSLLPSAAPGLPEELASRAEMAAELRSLVAAQRDEDASRLLIDWVQGGPGGFAALPADAQRGLLENAATIGPQFAKAQASVSRDELRRVETPTLVVAAARTRLYYRLIAEACAAALPHAQFATVDDARHMSIVERPGAVARAIAAHLSGVD